MRRHDAQSPERKIGEARIKLGLRMTGQKAPAHPRAPAGRRARSAAKVPNTVRRGWASGSPFPVEAKQHRRAAVLLQIGGMGGKPGDQNKRRTVNVVATLTREPNGWPVLRSMVAMPRPASPAAGSWQSISASKSAAGAFSGQAAGHEARQSGAVSSASAIVFSDFSRSQELPRLCLVLSHFRLYMGIQRLMGPGLVMLRPTHVRRPPCQPSLSSMTTAIS